MAKKLPLCCLYEWVWHALDELSGDPCLFCTKDMLACDNTVMEETDEEVTTKRHKLTCQECKDELLRVANLAVEYLS